MSCRTRGAGPPDGTVAGWELATKGHRVRTVRTPGFRSARHTPHPSRRVLGAALALALLGIGIPAAMAEPDPTTFPSAEQVAGAKAAAGDAAAAVAALDAQLAAARVSLEEAQDRVGVAAEAYSAAQDAADLAAADSAEAAAKASRAQQESEAADLALSRYAAEVFQGGSGLGQLDLYFGGGPGEALDRAAGLEVVGEERARVLAEAKRARATFAVLQGEAEAAAMVAAAAAQRAQTTMADAQQAAADADSAARAVSEQQEAGLAQLASLRNTSIELERQRQEGLAAIERARIEAENRRKAQERARAEAARQAELVRQEAARIEAARREAARLELARQEAARKAAQNSGSTSGTTSGSAGSTKSGSTAASGSNTAGTSGTTGTTAGSSAAAGAVAFAKAQLGEPYVWAGTGPNSWDCSGLTMKAWLSVGERLPRTAQSQYDATTHIAIADLRPGDLVFYGKTSSGIYHVGMYVGNGTMIHAPRTGDVVKYSSIYYMRDLLPYGGRV